MKYLTQNLLSVVISLFLLLLLNVYVYGWDCNDAIRVDKYCPGACVNPRAGKDYKCLKEADKIRFVLGDRVYVYLQSGFVAKNFVIEKPYCKGNRCSRPYSSDGKMFVKVKAGKNTLYKGAIPESNFPVMLNLKIKGPKFIYFDIFPNRGSKGYSAGPFGDGFIIRGYLSFDIVPEH